MFNDAWYVFEPVDPVPASAPVTVVMHGYGDYAGYEMHRALIEHAVRQGNIVVYPRWQTSLITPCPGGFWIDPCIQSATNGVNGALDFLQHDRGRVQPRVDEIVYFGHSFGGILTTNMANRWQALGLPRPQAILLDDPTDGGFSGRDETGLDDALLGVPDDIYFQCLVGEEGVLAEPGKAEESCNAIFRRIHHIPPQNKEQIMYFTDNHGVHELSSRHGASAGAQGGYPVDSYDYMIFWRKLDRLRDAVSGPVDPADPPLGDTPQNRYTGTWSDGTPVTPLRIQNFGPIYP